MNFKIVFCFIVINVHFIFSLMSQNWEIPNIHYTMKNGLPSNEVYDVLEDSIGYIWLTTDNGLCRFDGYEFKTYGLEKGLTDRVVFDMQLDTFGRIWMNSINGKILYYSPELDSIIDDPFINFDKNAFKGNKTSYYFDNKLNKLIVNFPTQKLKRHISFDLENRKIVYKTPDRAWISKSGYLLKVYDEFNKQLPENILMDKFGNPILRVRPLVGSNEFKTYINFIPFGKYHLLSTFKRAIILKNPFSIVIPRAIINDADVLEDSTYYISYGADYGLRKYHGLNNFIKDKAEVILDNTTISNFYSQKKLFWVSSASTGLYKIFNSDYDFKISYQKDILKTIIFNDKFYIFFKDKSVAEFNTRKGTIKYKNRKNGILVSNVSVIYDKIIVRSLEGQNYYYENSTFEKVLGKDKINNKHFSAFPGFNLYEDNDKNIIWGTQSVGLMKYNVKLKNWKRLDRSRTYCLLTNKKGKILAGTADGLFTIEKDSFKDEFRNKDPFLKRRIDFMIENYDGTIILAAKNEGIYLFNNNQLKFIDVYNQYHLNFIKGIYLQDKNKVWLNTSKGVFILSINNNNAKVVDIINKFDGLPDDEINDILFLNGEVFFIYSNSIVKFKNKLSPERTTPKFKPFLENLMVHNTNHPVSDSMVFTSEQNNLMLKFIALDYAQNGKLNYQYSINGSKYRDLGLERKLNLFQLAPGKYKIALRVQNSEFEWGDSKTYFITILPPWWKTWWFFCLVGFSISFITYLFMRRRIQIQRRESNLREEIRTLEKAALQAQMNPHFIFNSLNSIQKFIMANDKELASEYLSKFATLIRLNLKSSNSDWILLQDEINLLSLYLELEKLRFKNKFDYEFKIQMEEELLNKLKIPPMLIQPIIENAIVHGIDGIEDKGIINISLMHLQDRKSILVEVTDNGKGIGNNVKNGHQSLGSKITKKRLELISQSEKDNFTLKNINNEENIIIGAKAQMYIKYSFI